MPDCRTRSPGKAERGVKVKVSATAFGRSSCIVGSRLHIDNQNTTQVSTATQQWRPHWSFAASVIPAASTFIFFRCEKRPAQSLREQSPAPRGQVRIRQQRLAAASTPLHDYALSSIWQGRGALTFCLHHSASPGQSTSVSPWDQTTESAHRWSRSRQTRWCTRNVTSPHIVPCATACQTSSRQP